MPDRQAIIEYILDHYENPRHHGPMPDADLVMRGGNPGCGDLVTLYLRLEGETIRDISFEGEGCTISQAAASVLTDQVIGKTLEQVTQMDASDFIEELGKEVVTTRLRCATLALNTLKAAEQKYRHEQHAAGADDEVLQF